MAIICTQCHQNIDSKLANVETDLIQCPNCHTVHELSELVKSQKHITQEITPLTGSKIKITNTDSFLIMRIPPRKLRGSDILPLLIAAFLVCYEVNGVLQYGFGGLLNWAYSLPFFGVGVWILVTILTALSEHQLIELNRHSMNISKKGIFSTEKTRIVLSDIHIIKLNKKINEKIESVTIIHGVEETTILENLSEQEQEWGLNLLKTTLMQIAEKKV